MLRLCRVVGQSMTPSLEHGQLVWGLKLKKPQKGDIVVANNNGRDIIKRVAKISSQGYFLLGDNPRLSTDSRDFGWVLPEAIKYTIINRG